MMRSLFSGVSGLRNHQTRMDVIGNNIANVNTAGFKSSTVQFQDVLSQTVQGSASPQGDRGGTNPMQVGLGMSVASISTQFTDGSFQPTGKQTDLSIKGSGLFVLADGNNRLYTRAGNFDFDTDGNYLVPGTGYKVMGWMADTSGNIDTAQPITALRVPVGASMPAKVSSKITVENNLSASAPIGEKAQASLNVYDSLGNAHKVNTQYFKVANNTWLAKTSVSDPTSGAAGNTWRQLTFTNSGQLSSVVTATVPQTTGYTIPGFQMDSTPNAVHTQNFLNIDASGNPHTYQLTVTTDSTTTAANGKYSWELKETGVAGATTTTGQITYSTANGYNSPLDGTSSMPAINGITLPVPTAAPGAGAWNCVPTLTPAVTAGTTDAPFTVTFANGSSPMSLTLDQSALTQFGGSSTIQATKTDGYAAGSLNKTTIDSSGILVGSFTNGQSMNLGQIALATFNNPGGLDRVGDSMYAVSNNSGQPQVGAAGIGGRGSFNSGQLEMSNVDLSQEFSNMIITERGFQANSKIITTSDEMLQELTNLKR